MNNLNDQELQKVSGGGAGLWLAIGGVLLLAIGILDGYRNPLKCNNG